MDSEPSDKNEQFGRNSQTIDQYEIRVQGHLADRWSGQFDCLILKREDSGQTQLICAVADQAALFGLLRKVRDTGLPLLSVNLLSEKTHKR